MFRIVCAFLFSVAATVVAAQPLVLKLGTVAPEDTPWDTSLHEIAASWSHISNGDVSVKIYSGAVAGDEDDIIRKMRIDQIQCAALTGVGLSQIVEDTQVFEIPFLFRNEAEFRYVLDKMTPEFSREFERHGFELLKWDLVGWINIFSRRPVVDPESLMSQKLAVPTDTDPNIIAGWQRAGFQVTPVAVPDLMTALSSGMVDAFYTAPLAAAAYQWFAEAKNMTSLRLAPLIGGVVVNKRTWDAIPVDYQSQFVDAVDQAEASVLPGMDSMEKQAMDVMLNNGLQVNAISADEESAWRSVMTGGFEALSGKSYSSAVYGEVTKLLADYRAREGA